MNADELDEWRKRYGVGDVPEPKKGTSNCVVKLCFGGFLVWFAVWSVYILLAFVATKQLPSGEYVDGFGRLLELPPFFIQLLYRGRLWPGVKWFVIDMVFCWGSPALWALMVGKLKSNPGT